MDNSFKKLDGLQLPEDMGGDFFVMDRHGNTFPFLYAVLCSLANEYKLFDSLQNFKLILPKFRSSVMAKHGSYFMRRNRNLTFKGINCSLDKKYQINLTEEQVFAFNEWKQLCAKNNDMSSVHERVESYCGNRYNDNIFHLARTNDKNLNRFLSENNFEDFVINYLNVAKVGTVVAPHKLGIVSSDLTPYIKLAPLVAETGYPIAQSYPHLEFDTKLKKFIAKEPTLLQRTADRSRKEQLEEFLGKDLSV